MNRRRDLDGGKLMNPGRAKARRRLRRVSKTIPRADHWTQQYLDHGGANLIRMFFSIPPTRLNSRKKNQLEFDILHCVIEIYSLNTVYRQHFRKIRKIEI